MRAFFSRGMGKGEAGLSGNAYKGGGGQGFAISACVILESSLRGAIPGAEDAELVKKDVCVEVSSYFMSSHFIYIFILIHAGSCLGLSSVLGSSSVLGQTDKQAETVVIKKLLRKWKEKFCTRRLDKIIFGTFFHDTHTPYY